MVYPDAREVPVDPLSAQRLSGTGLVYRIADLADPAAARAFVRAETRGFLDQEPDDESVRATVDMMAARRNVGVYAATAGSAVDALPVATVDSWVTPMTVPGGGHVPMWAISAVTVAGTHRRRGIARSLLEGELRAAVGAGIPVAGLTATEATIYGRYGFGPAAPVARVEVDARRAGGIAPEPAGVVEYVDREQLPEALSQVHECAREQRAGQIPGWPLRWMRLAGTAPGEEKGRAVRGAQYRDADGVVRGVLVYALEILDAEFGADLVIRHLVADAPEALRALWAFAVNHDLIRTVRADLQPVDDPLPWLVADQRAVRTTVHDHGWLRILDVPSALGARSYRAPLDLVIRVSDPLGFAEGSWRVRIGQDGAAVIEPTADAADIALDVAALSSLYLGGVSATTLRAAGRITATADSAASFDDAFGSASAPTLSIWY